SVDVTLAGESACPHPAPPWAPVKPPKSKTVGREVLIVSIRKTGARSCYNPIKYNSMNNSALLRITALVCLPMLALAQSPGPDKSQKPLATVNGQSIYEDDLTAVGAQLWQLRNQEYQIKSTALENV